jgi:hypothetical protein
MMWNQLDRSRLKLLLWGLRSANRLPFHLELARIGDTAIANAYNSASSLLIQESVSTGFAHSSDRALLKALSEYIERKALMEAGESGFEACQTPRSDGMAAFPIVLNLPSRAKKIARANAYYEAIERYAWATWWDNPEIRFAEMTLKDLGDRGAVKNMIAAAMGSMVVKSVRIIEPELSNSNVRVLILLAELEGGGWLSGGAAGFADAAAILFRAAAELVRHANAVIRIRNGGRQAETFYERRVAYFGLGSGDKLVSARFRQKGSRGIKLPALRFDTPVPHSLEHLAAVHRCYFVDQPMFIGGDLERLCI